jgi:uncharacterized protein with FMN-binding domain
LWCAAIGLAALLSWGSAAPAAADTIELLTGAKVEGKVLQIDQAGMKVVFQAMIAGRALTRTYEFSRIRAVIHNGRRIEITADEAPPTSGTPGSTPGNPAGSGTSGSNPSRPSTTPAGGPATGQAPRTSAAAIERLIDEAGRTPPDWFDATPLNYPQTLDLSWPDPPPQGWNNQRNIGQYLWDIINPNPSRWREGIKLLHHLLTVNKDNPATQRRVMHALGEKYHDLMEDYARAAFWLRQAGVDKPGSPFPESAVTLAECYWKLGSREMATELLSRMPVYYSSIKLWADMGDLRRALQIADAALRDPRGLPYAANLYAGDACRVAGQYTEAMSYYQKVLSYQAPANDANRAKRWQDRARASLEAIRLFELCDPSKVPDGSYRASSLGYEGQVEVEVTVQAGRIADVRVTQHREKQFYSALTDTPRKIIAKQGVKGVDATSSATITSEAIINATAKALAAARP